MQVTKIIIADDRIKVDYSTDAGEFKINLSGDLPSPDLIDSIKKLGDIFASRLNLDDKDHSNFTRSTGIESGFDDAGKVWYRVHGTYVSNNITYKLATGKMRLADFEFGEDQDPDDYPYLLTDEEYDRVVKAIEEAAAFVDGKRKTPPQLELDLDENKKEEA
jgi:hypothetical protein